MTSSKAVLKVHSYESTGTLDGPGLRYVVFLQGCQFQCLYCANRDTWNCGVGAGEEVSIDELYNRISRHREFFGKRGGVTFSGGEPLLQARELIPLCERLQETGIDICVDTNGGINTDDAREVLSMCGTVLLDIKSADADIHKVLTRKTLEPVLDTIEFLESNYIKTWIRHVLVPGYTTGDRELRKLGELLQGYSCIDRVEILPYHTLGKHKWKLLEKEYMLEDTLSPTEEEKELAVNILSEYVDNVILH